MFIYIIENKLNGKIYIGKTKYKNPNQRWSTHKCQAKKYPLYPISKAILKYGDDNFTFTPIKYCDNDDQLIQEEIYWIECMRKFLGKNMVYNVSDGGDGGRYLKGRKLSEEHKRKISESAKKSTNSGRFAKNHPVPESWKEKIIMGNRNMDRSTIDYSNRKANKTSFKKGNVPWNKRKK